LRPLLRRHGALRDLTDFLKRRNNSLVDTLDGWIKLYPAGFNLAAYKSVGLQRVIRIGAVDSDQNIGFDPVGLASTGIRGGRVLSVITRTPDIVSFGLSHFLWLEKCEEIISMTN
jgi:hypothetical protein